MNNLEKFSSGTVQIWQALPIWGRVLAVFAGAIGLYYSFALIIGLFFFAALGVGLFTLLRWLLRRP